MPWLGIQGGGRAWAEEGPEIHVVLSERSQAYQEVADAFVGSVGRRHVIHTHILDLTPESELREMDRPGRLIVPVGVRATRRVADVHAGRSAVLALLVPRTAMEAIRWGGNMDGRVSAVYLDQPIHRSLALIQLLSAKADRVGILVSEEGAENVRAYRAEASRHKLQLVHETVAGQNDVAPALQRLLPQIDVLLLIPDPSVVNEHNARMLLVSSYRQHIPVVAFSRGLVNAGAVASVVSDPADIGREGALLAQQWNPWTGALPPPRAASSYSLAVNRRVAASLDIRPDSEENMLRRLHEGDAR